MPAGIVSVSKVTEADDRNLDSLPKNDLVNRRKWRMFEEVGKVMPQN